MNYERSGSCAIVVIIVNDACFVANLGDSRALLSENNFENAFLLSKDHKPNDSEEKTRIINAGGFVFQGDMPSNNVKKYSKFLDSPWRISPGRLSVKLINF